MKGRAPKPERKKAPERKRTGIKPAEQHVERAYHTRFPAIAAALTLSGKNKAEIAHTLGVRADTFSRWLNLHPELAQACEMVPEIANAQVTRSLYERACGYEAKEDVVKFIPELDDKGKKTGGYVPLVVSVKKQWPPDTAAAALWLTNRDPARWKQKTEVQVDLAIQVRRALLELPEE